MVLRGICPAASSSLSRFSHSLCCLSRRTLFKTWAVFVWSWVHLSRVFGSSFRFVIISRDIARLCWSCSIIADRSSFSSGSSSISPVSSCSVLCRKGVFCFPQLSSRASSGSGVQRFLPEYEGSHDYASQESDLSLVQCSFLGPLFQFIQDNRGQSSDVGQQLATFALASFLSLFRRLFLQRASSSPIRSSFGHSHFHHSLSVIY